MRHLLPTLLLLAGLLASCGGGDGPSAGDILNGQWTGTMAPVSNNGCGNFPPHTVTQTVTVIGDEVTVSFGLRGRLIADNAFDASIQNDTVFFTYSYRDVADDRAQVTLTTVESPTCTRVKAGTLTRS